MKYYQVNAWEYFVEEDCSHLGLCGHSTRPLTSLQQAFDYIKSYPCPENIDAFVIKKIDSDKKYITNSIKEHDDLLLNFDDV